VTQINAAGTQLGKNWQKSWERPMWRVPMMWMMVWRPLVVLFGLVQTVIALITMVISLNPPASDALMTSVFVMMAAQGAVGVGLIVYGLLRPFRRWLQEREGARAG
jgi:hypothetical protein